MGREKWWKFHANMKKEENVWSSQRVEKVKEWEQSPARQYWSPLLGHFLCHILWGALFYCRYWASHGKMAYSNNTYLSSTTYISFSILGVLWSSCVDYLLNPPAIRMQVRKCKGVKFLHPCGANLTLENGSSVNVSFQHSGNFEVLSTRLFRGFPAR